MSNIQQTNIFDTEPNDIIQIDTSCGETEPCCHSVFMNGTFYATMDGVQIVKLLEKHRQRIPDHFKCYIGGYFNPGMELFG